MAELAGVVVEEAVSGLLAVIIKTIKKAWYFNSQLKEMQETLKIMEPDFKNLEQLSKKLDRRKAETERFKNLLKEAKDLVEECKKIKLKYWKRNSHASKLDEMNKSLLKLVQVDLQLHIAVTVDETLEVVKATHEVVKALEKVTVEGSSSGLSSGVPPERCDAVGFDDRVRDLKAMLLKDSTDGDCSVVVVSAAGGCGKTTLVTKLCHDSHIQERFGRNIYFVTVSRTYNKKVVIKSLLGELPGNIDDDVAVQQWGSFLGKTTSEVLLVLDDVWSASVITDFKFKSPRYKILVTSRITFNKFKTYPLPALNDEDATRLFRVSAFCNQGNEHNYISDDLVHKLVKCCKNHPLVLSVVGSLLNGTPVDNWEFMLKELYEENKSVLDLDVSILNCLQKSLYFFTKEDKMKQCYMDLGLFPEDQKIAASALRDMWTHLYKHDEKGMATTNILTNLSSKNLATQLPVRKHLANYCEEGSVTQHDMMRALAIHLSSQEPRKDRERLIVNLDGKDLPELPQTVNARILSISTGLKIGERFPLSWNEIRALKVEVLVLSFMSNMHPLPQFMQHMDNLKVLMITNYGYYFSEIQNFPAPVYLTGLTKIRLDHVSISSISTTILMLENLQKLSLIMCKIGNSFDKGNGKRLTSLSEIDIDSCDDLLTFPATLCNVINLQKLSITNCHELTSVSEEFGKLSNLEVFRLTSCTKLPILPESTRHLKKLRIVDLYHCLSLCKLPQDIGELSSLETINLMGCTGLIQHELPKSVKEFDKVKVVCDEEISHLMEWFDNVEIEVVEEDPLDTLFKINPNGFK
ncbi:putative disease resistance protein At5g66900 [Bidens hawaiensis]|uniref:putative disease resistance protein At5g66900 n=1 Tax=Bidens hawaiensis TaxID=980011 RepID=UPI00404930CB